LNLNWKIAVSAKRKRWKS